LYTQAIKGKQTNVVGVDLPYDKPDKADLTINNTQITDIALNVEKIYSLIKGKL